MSESPAWLLLIGSLSGQNQTARMRLWRSLKFIGAGALRDGAYLLPCSPTARQTLQALADDLIVAGGSAHLLALDAADDAQQQAFQILFDRSEEYAALLDRLRTLKAGLPKLEETEARRQSAAIGREIVALSAIDFFPGAPRRQIESARIDLEAAINTRYSPDEPHALRGGITHRDKRDFKARTWATREHLWIDRVCSAWLIRRHVDPRAKFLWLKRAKDCPKQAIGFDFDGATFSHVGDRVTFEVLLASFGLEQDLGLARLASLVHYLDVGGVPVAEAAGLSAIVAGARAGRIDDDALLKTIMPVLDHIYAAYSQPTPE